MLPARRVPSSVVKLTIPHSRLHLHARLGQDCRASERERPAHVGPVLGCRRELCVRRDAVVQVAACGHDRRRGACGAGVVWRCRSGGSRAAAVLDVTKGAFGASSAFVFRLSSSWSTRSLQSSSRVLPHRRCNERRRAHADLCSHRFLQAPGLFQIVAIDSEYLFSLSGRPSIAKRSSSVVVKLFSAPTSHSRVRTPIDPALFHLHRVAVPRRVHFSPQ